MTDAQHAQAFPPHLYGLLAALTLAWGINWSVMKTVLTEMPPMHFRSLCLLFGAAGLFALAALSGLRIRVPAGQWPRLVLIALVNVGGWNVFVIYGIPLMASGRAAILGYTMPLWAIIFSGLVLGDRLSARRALGLALGMGGMLLLLGSELQAVGRAPLGALLVIAGAMSWGMGTVLMKRWPVDLPTSSFIAWQLLVSFVPILALALTLEAGSFNPFRLSFWPMFGVCYNVVVAFNFCYWAWTKIALVAPVAVSGLSSMMIPVVGVFSGMLFLGETPRWSDYAALLLVVGAQSTVLLPAVSRKVGRPQDSA
jgi:drug/metabolite transporter (DMT)-like permease